MFSFFKKKEEKYVLGAPVKGKSVPLKEVSDPTFAEEMLGKGMAGIPADGGIYAPGGGGIGVLFGARVAVSVTRLFGGEVLIHVGIDTVKMNGDGFEAHVSAGDRVKKGDLLLAVDLDKVKAAGYDTITPMLVCNTADYASVEGITGDEISPGDDAVIIIK